MSDTVPHFIETPRRESAPTLLCVHGAGGNHTHWGFQVRDLCDVAQVVAVDLPGHGKSPPIPDVSIDAYADSIERVVERIGGTNVVIAGHSMGGAIALTIGLRRPAWLCGLVLVGTGAKLRVAPAFLEGLEKDHPSACREIIAWSVGPDCPAAIRERALADYAACDPRVVLEDFRACDRFDVRERLGEIAVPALVLCGSADRMTPPRYSEFLANRIPQATLAIIPGCGHLVMIENPTAVNERIRSQDKSSKIGRA